jgi:hypothetical protein
MLTSRPSKTIWWGFGHCHAKAIQLQFLQKNSMLWIEILLWSKSVKLNFEPGNSCEATPNLQVCCRHIPVGSLGDYLLFPLLNWQEEPLNFADKLISGWMHILLDF